MDSDIVEFVKYTLIKDPNERPDIQALKNHQLYKNLNWDKVIAKEYESPILH